MKLLRAFIKAQGYEIEELDAKPCVKQCEGVPTIFDGGNYKVTKMVAEKANLLELASKDFQQKLKEVEYSSYNRSGTNEIDFGESVI